MVDGSIKCLCVFVVGKLTRDVESQIESLILKLNRRLVVGSTDVALETAKLLRNVISGSRWTDPGSLVEIVMEVDARLDRAQPIELSAGSMAKRVLHLIREEEHVLDVEPDVDESESDADSSIKDRMKIFLRQGISEMIDELETASSNVAAQALEHIHSNEIIMTIGGSPVINQFLKEAAKLRTFQVIIAETAPFYNGHDMAVALAGSGIDVTLITDSAIFAVMSRVNKVILGAHAVTANGGIISICGSHAVTSSAKHHSTPVVVCTGLHTLSPLYPYDTDAFNLCVNPDALCNFDDDKNKDVDVPNTYYDYVPPDHLSLFITNMGPHPPSYIQRLVSESYVF